MSVAEIEASEPRRNRFARYAVRAAFFVLGILLATGLATGAYPVMAWLLFIPWLLAVPGVWQHNPYTMRWLCLALSLFLLLGLTELIASPSDRLWSSAMVMTSVTSFVFIVLALRIASRSRLGKPQG